VKTLAKFLQTWGASNDVEVLGLLLLRINAPSPNHHSQETQREISLERRDPGGRRADR